MIKSEYFQFIDLLEHLKIPYALMGGIAVGYWAEERYTKDLDLAILLNRQSWALLENRLKTDSNVQLELIANEEGFDTPYLIRMKFKGDLIDCLVALTSFEFSLLERRLRIEMFGRSLTIITPEDLIICKLIADRLQDQVDIQQVISYSKELDWSYIQKWVQFWNLEDRWNLALKRTQSLTP